ncbi:ATP-binding protein, partial [Streptomyces sp. NPDC026672]|uniref:ATP-binding protein n=1 Tax=unclassified Streptomyces TaxID=2593676 RepID=UPI003401209C
MNASRGEGRSLGARVHDVRAHRFVGRAAEQKLFASMLTGENPTAVLWVHGPGGIGKSTLLERFADDSRAAGRRVVRLDCRDTGPSSDDFSAALDTASGGSGSPDMVVLVDAFEQCGHLETWFRKDFLPGLPADTIVVVAGRCPPEASWQADIGWDGLLRVIALRNLSPREAVSFLDAREVPAGLHDRLLAFTGGHPLALALAAQVASADPPVGSAWTPGPDVIGTLLSALVNAVPSAAHRHALEVCAHAYDTTEDLLRSVLDG